MKTLASIMAAIFIVASINTLVNCNSIVCKWLMRPMNVLFALGEGDTASGVAADVIAMKREYQNAHAKYIRMTLCSLHGTSSNSYCPVLIHLPIYTHYICRKLRKFRLNNCIYLSQFQSKPSPHHKATEKKRRNKMQQWAARLKSNTTRISKVNDCR